MAGVVVRRGIGRDVVAGIIWTLLRIRHSCLRAAEIVEALQGIGINAGRGMVYRALREYTDILWRRTRLGNHILYCALEEVM